MTKWQNPLYLLCITSPYCKSLTIPAKGRRRKWKTLASFALEI